MSNAHIVFDGCHLQYAYWRKGEEREALCVNALRSIRGHMLNAMRPKKSYTFTEVSTTFVSGVLSPSDESECNQSFLERARP